MSDNKYIVIEDHPEYQKNYFCKNISEVNSLINNREDGIGNLKDIKIAVVEKVYRISEDMSLIEI